MDIQFSEKQTLAFQSSAREILYGGAAGGGKSFFSRAVSVIWCMQVPGLQVYLFRRISPDLVKNHMEGPKGFRALLADFVLAGHVQIVEDEIRFKNGSRIFLCHCKDEADRFKYQGAEIHVLVIDELTHFTEDIYRFLRSRVRMAGLVVPPEYKDRFPRILCSSNPGGIGHQWVKAAWIDRLQPMQIETMPPEEGGMTRQFIPARLEDNPHLLAEDPNYRAKLKGLGHPELVRAMEEGDWDIVSGAALEKLSREKHSVRQFTPPVHWTRFTSIDWGTAKPFAVGWFCVAEGGCILKGRDGAADKHIPDGAVILYREYYGWNGKPDVGCRLESHDVAKKIIQIERDSKEPRIDYRVADSQMWAETDGPSPAERMFKATEGRLNMRQAVKDRKMNYQEIRARIEGEDGVPMFYATDNCHHFWRTCPSLTLDETNPEKGPDTKQEDHMYDCVSYALRSRPMIHTEHDRKRAEHGRLMAAVKKAQVSTKRRFFK